MPAPLATVEQVAARVGEDISDDASVALAEACLEEASAWVRHYGGHDWPDPLTAPAVAVAITIAAAHRAYQNPAGFDTERADMASFKRGERYQVGAELTASEILILTTLAGGGGIVSAPLSNPEQIVPRSHGRRYDRGYVPMDWGQNKPFPWGW